MVFDLGSFWNFLSNPGSMLTSTLARSWASVLGGGKGGTKPPGSPYNPYTNYTGGSTPSNMTTAMMDFNQLRLKEGATVALSTLASWSISVAAANTMRIEYISALSTAVQTICNANDGSNPIYSRYVLNMDFTSDLNFQFLPFFVMMENGESFTNSNYNGTDPVAAAQTCLGSEDLGVQWGPLVQAKLIKDGGNKFMLHAELDCTQAVNAYAKHYASKEMQEQTALVLYVAGIWIGQPQTITGNQTTATSYFLKPRSVGDLARML